MWRGQLIGLPFRVGLSSLYYYRKDLFDQYGDFTPWASQASWPVAEMQEGGAGRHAMRLEGRLNQGQWEWRAQWVKLHPKEQAVSAFGLDCLGYRAMDAMQAQAGLHAASLQSFVDEGGRKRYQVTWSAVQ